MRLGGVSVRFVYGLVCWVSTYELNPTKLGARGVSHPLGCRDIFWNFSAIALFNQLIQGRSLVFLVNKTQ